MKITDFRKVYNPQNRCLVTYRSKSGYTVKGIVLDAPHKSLTGKYFVNVDSFTNAVRMENIVKVEDTGRPWTEIMTAPARPW